MATFVGNPLTLGQIPASGTQLVTMTPAERARHTYIVGATRTGKSKLLEDCIRQDILAWPRSGCGVMVLDRHGSLYDNLIKWTAAMDMVHWPIVPIDLRRSDWIVSYNPLRRRGRGEEAAVIVGNFVRSILHAWGQSNLSETPRLVKWLEATLLVLHEHSLTLAEALQLITSPAVRQAMTSHVEDLVLKSIWETAPAKEADFQEQVESTVNRVRRFLSRRVMRATLGQPDVSLDLHQALEDGQIILAAIATEGAKIDEEDASTLGSLFLSDLWMAAKARGKRDEGEVKPFYVYLDEFQEYVTPAMAETLDQASGFGLHMTLAHQFPSQLLRNEQGKQIYNSVMANCRSKIVFHLEHNEDVKELAMMLYREQVDLKRVKHELYATKVLGYKLEYLPSYSTGTSTSVGGGEEESVTEGTNESWGTTWSHTDGESRAHSISDGLSASQSLTFGTNHGLTSGYSTSDGTSQGFSAGESDSEGSSWSESDGSSFAASEGDGENWGSSRGENSGGSRGTGRSRSQSHSFGRPSDEFQDELVDLFDGTMNKSETNALKRRASGMSISEGESDNDSESWGTSSSDSSGGSRSRSETRGLSKSRSRGGSRGHSTNLARSEGENHSDGSSLARNRGESRSTGSQLGRSHSESDTFGTSHSDSVGGSETFGTSTAITRGVSRNWSEGQSQSETMSPMLLPIMGQELSSVTFETVEEQLFRFAQFLSGQRDRHCVVKLVAHSPVPVMTLTVTPALTTAEWTEAWTSGAVQGLGFALPLDVALARIVVRQKELPAKLMALPVAGEPVMTRRSVAAKVAELPAKSVDSRANGRRKPC